jgi:glycosyltransferase involved in cell wall biosynthesis
MLIIVSHATLVNGHFFEPPTNTISETLLKEKKNFIFIRHSLNGEFKSIIYIYEKGILIHEKNIFSIRKNSFLRFLSQPIMTIYHLLLIELPQHNTLIGVSPLNAISGIILKLFKKINKTIFYSVDFTPSRFPNIFLSKIYNMANDFAAKYSDEIWAVSTRIQKIYIDKGISKNKIRYIPNVPSSEYIKFKFNKRNKYHLVTLGVIDKQLDFINLFKAINALKKDFPEIFLKIIGSGPDINHHIAYVKKNHLSKYVKFYGFMNHKKALEEISKSGIGIALYSGQWNFNYFGDSMKCREFFSFGIPVITTNTHSTVDDIRKFKAGIISDTSSKDYRVAIEEIINNYNSFKNNSQKLGDRYKDIHNVLLKSYE